MNSSKEEAFFCTLQKAVAIYGLVYSIHNLPPREARTDQGDSQPSCQTFSLVICVATFNVSIVATNTWLAMYHRLF